MNIEKVLQTGNVAAFVSGFIGAFIFGIPAWAIIFPVSISSLLLSAIVFSLSFLFFGFTTPLILFLTGVFLGWLLKMTGVLSAFIIFSSLSVLFMGFASVKMGLALLSDLTEKGNFRESLKISSILILPAILISFITDFLVVT